MITHSVKGFTQIVEACQSAKVIPGESENVISTTQDSLPCFIVSSVRQLTKNCLFKPASLTPKFHVTTELSPLHGRNEITGRLWQTIILLAQQAHQCLIFLTFADLAGGYLNILVIRHFFMRIQQSEQNICLFSLHVLNESLACMPNLMQIVYMSLGNSVQIYQCFPFAFADFIKRSSCSSRCMKVVTTCVLSSLGVRHLIHNLLSFTIGLPLPSISS